MTFINNRPKPIFCKETNMIIKYPACKDSMNDIQIRRLSTIERRKTQKVSLPSLKIQED